MRHMLMSRLLCGVAFALMAREEQHEYARCGNGDPTGICKRVDRVVPVTVVSSATASATVNVPQGATRLTLALDTETAFTGAPTNVNVTIGSTPGGSDVMAATDVHAQGHIAGAVAAGYPNINFAANAGVTLYVTVTTVGGTAVGGVVNVSVGYGVPVEPA